MLLNTQTGVTTSLILPTNDIQHENEYLYLLERQGFLPYLGHILKKVSNKMSTDLCVPAYLGAGPGTWREEGQSQSHIPRRPSTVLSAFPPGTSATRLAASSTASLDHHEYLKSGPGVLLQSVWGVVAEKEQRFGVQPRVTRSAYSRRRSLSGAVKRGRKEKGLTKKLVKGLEGEYSFSLSLT